MRHARALAIHLSFAAVLMAGAAEAADSQLVMGTGAGTGPAVRLVTALDDRSLVPYDTVFLGGVNVALGDIDGDGIADVITGTGFGGQPHVRVFSGTDLHVIASFLAYDPGFLGGIDVASGDVAVDIACRHVDAAAKRRPEGHKARELVPVDAAEHADVRRAARPGAGDDVGPAVAVDVT